MSTETWSAVDQYFIETLGLADAALEHALRESERAGLPAISVSAPQGKLLQILARCQDESGTAQLAAEIQFTANRALGLYGVRSAD